MALSEITTFEPSAAELINLRKILDRCKVPDVGPFALLPELAVDQHYCFALDRFETTSRVFDKSYYEEEVLSVVMNEEKLDEILQNEARAKGVPESHFPSPPKRRRARPMRSKAPLLSPLNLPRVYESTNLSPTLNPSITFSEAQGSIIEGGIMSPRSSIGPSLPLENSENKGVQFRIPTATNSVLSFMSESSKSSWHPQKQQKRRRDSLIQFFRRGSSNSSFHKDRGLFPDDQFNPPSIAEVPELSSPNSHESQDLSSLQSLSVSTRTSISSFVDPLNPTLSMSDQRAISVFKKTQRFRTLQWQCDCEVLRFTDFAQHQRVALPLIVGRNRLYLEDRKRAKLVEFKKKVRRIHVYNILPYYWLKLPDCAEVERHFSLLFEAVDPVRPGTPADLRAAWQLKFKLFSFVALETRPMTSFIRLGRPWLVVHVDFAVLGNHAFI